MDASSLPAAQSGQPVMAEVHGGSASGLALVNPQTGTVSRMIEPFSEASQAMGAYDGQYAVWKETHIAGDSDHFTVKEWNAATGTIKTVGSAHYGPHHQVVESSIQDPILAGDRAARVESLRNDGYGEIVVLNLRTGRRTIVHRGHPGWLALTKTELVWAESSTPGAETTIRAINLTSDKPSPPPTALAHARGAWGFVTDGTAWAWVASGDTTAIYGAASATAKPVRISTLSDGASPPLAITHGVVTVPVSAGGLMIVDLSTMTWAEVPAASYAVNDGPDRLAITKLVTNKEGNVRSIANITSTEAALHC